MFKTAVVELDDLDSPAFKGDTPPLPNVTHRKQETMLDLKSNNLKKDPNKQNTVKNSETEHTVALRFIETENTTSLENKQERLTEKEVYKVLTQVAAVKSVVSVLKKENSKEWHVVVISTRRTIGLVRFSCRSRTYSIEVLT